MFKQFCEKLLKAVNELEKDLMPGGLGDNKPDSSFDSESLKSGTKKEQKEHGLDEKRAKEIAKDHLTEDPDYYGFFKKADSYFNSK